MSDRPALYETAAFEDDWERRVRVLRLNDSVVIDGREMAELTPRVALQLARAITSTAAEIEDEADD